jgi:hypothetical protein
VVIGPRAAQVSGASQVAAFLTRYFTAINRRDYRTYVSLFDSQGQPIPNSRQFHTDYRSTADSHAKLIDLSPITAGWAATVTFISHQDPAASGTGSACTRWKVMRFLRTEGATYLIEPPPPGYRASRRPC